MRFRSFAAGLGLFIALPLATYPTGEARANGRFPQAQHIVSVPAKDASAEETVYLRATFGLLASRDGGKSFRFLCEQRFGYTGAWDPPIEATGDGRLFVGRADGLASTIDGCHVDEEAALAGETVKDLTTDGARTTLFAITSTPGKLSHVWKRTPEGTWQKLGKGLPDTNWLTIDVAPSRPTRVYVSGQPTGEVRGRIYVSDDGGATFVVREHSVKANGPYFLAAVDPIDPDRILLRHLHFEGSDFYVSKDGGKTITQSIHMESAMFGFAKSRDGGRYWIGSGLPQDGVLVSTDKGEHFEKVSSTGVLCLHASDRALLACGNPVAPGGVALLGSGDWGASFSPRLRFPEIAGPLECPGDGKGRAAAALCEAPWREALPLLQPASTKAPRLDGGRADGGAQRAPAARGGCGCSVGPSPRANGVALGSIALTLWAVLRWSRRDPLQSRSREKRALRGA